MCVSYEAGQVHRTILTACPSSLAAGKTVTPVIQAYEHSMESVCVSVCVCSQETVTVRGGEERGALLTLPETAECVDAHIADNDLIMMGTPQPQPGRANPSGSKTLQVMTR